MIMKKFIAIGLFRVLKAALKKIELLVKKPIYRILSFRRLANNNFSTTFIHEGNVRIKLPKVSPYSAMFDTNGILTQTISFYFRPQAEVLLRKIIFDLYDKNYLDSDKSIIDIGCWLADNSIVWASIISNKARVYAIDPSIKNLEFGKELANINDITNIVWVDAVCSDKVGIPLNFDGNIEHATFKEAKKSNHAIISTTLDEVVGDQFGTIGLLHVDVEEFESNVLKGASKIIEASRPVVTFEQHISVEDVSKIINFLECFNYKIFMINEVLPGCNLDCRNFIAFDENRAHPQLDDVEQRNGKDQGIFYACLGPQLIPVN